jgi:hypothetical protein
MAWLITHTLEAFNTEHIVRIYADKMKVRAQLTSGFAMNLAVDVSPEVGPRIVRGIIDQLAEGHSVEVVGEDVLPITNLR